ncbi:hypothetical protein N7540_008594 [Penicillium herquei]|nr:hypothetical protein N7540_008594 [Penicillium herquei]
MSSAADDMVEQADFREAHVEGCHRPRGGSLGAGQVREYTVSDFVTTQCWWNLEILRSTGSQHDLEIA